MFIKTGSLVLLNLVMYVVVLVILKDSYLKNKQIGKYSLMFSYLIALLFCVYAFWSGDFYSLIENIAFYLSGFDVHIEEGHKFILSNITSDYISYRFIVWGGTLFAFWVIAKRLQLDHGFSLLFLCALYLPTLSYARVSLAMALMCLAASFIFRPFAHKKALSYLVAGGLLYFSLQFHKSALFGVLIIVVVSILAVMKKSNKVIYLILLLFPALIVIVQYILADFMNINGGEDSLIDVNTGQMYLSRDIKERGLGELVGRYLYMAPFYILSCGYYKCTRKKLIDTASCAGYFGLIGFVIVAVSSVFAFDLNVNTSFLHYRFLNFAMIPMTILATELKTLDVCKRELNLAIIIGTAGALYTIVYAAYCAIVNPTSL